jgi:hypothetical protein
LLREEVAGKRSALVDRSDGAKRAPTTDVPGSLDALGEDRLAALLDEQVGKLLGTTQSPNER